MRFRLDLKNARNLTQLVEALRMFRDLSRSVAGGAQMKRKLDALTSKEAWLLACAMYQTWDALSGIEEMPVEVEIDTGEG